MTMGEYIRQLRKERGLTQEQLGEMLSPKVNRAAINKWEAGRVSNIKRSHIAQMATIFGVDPVKLMCFGDSLPLKNATPLNDTVRIPLLGKVAAGTPLFNEGNIIGEEYVDPRMVADGSSLFALRVSGDSMTPVLQNGDILIVREQPDADDGDIVVATVNGEEACVKKLKRYPDALALVSLNPMYEPMIFSGEQVDSLPVAVLGKVVQVRHNI